MVTRPFHAEFPLGDVWLWLAALGLIALIVGQAGTPAQTIPARERMDDRAISVKVRTALYKSVGARARHVSVDTTNGEVLLTGHVKSEADKAVAESTARAVSGVAAVSNQLDVR